MLSTQPDGNVSVVERKRYHMPEEECTSLQRISSLGPELVAHTTFSNRSHPISCDENLCIEVSHFTRVKLTFWITALLHLNASRKIAGGCNAQSWRRQEMTIDGSLERVVVVPYSSCSLICRTWTNQEQHILQQPQPPHLSVRWNLSLLHDWSLSTSLPT